MHVSQRQSKQFHVAPLEREGEATAGKAAETGIQKHVTLWTVGGPHAVDPRSPLHPSLGQSAETL